MKENDYKHVDYSSYRTNTDTVDATIGGTVAQATGMRMIMNRVYNWMFGGLMLTALTAYGMTLSLDLMLFARSTFWIFAIAEIVLVIALSASLRKISYAAACVMFGVYAVLNGVTLSLIFLAYNGSTVFAAFAACSLMFGGASLYAYLTHSDLSKVGSICIMAVWGLIIASLLNFFFASTMLDVVISYVGVLVFVGLTAYDTQKIRVMAEELGEEAESEMMKKFALIGALNLYLDFINLFLYLLRILGKKR